MLYNEYITNRGLMNSGTTSNRLNEMFTDFVDYVDSFYGQNDPLYPLEKNGQPLSRVDITKQFTNTYSYVLMRVKHSTLGETETHLTEKESETF